jgi:two-component SAPR family response regulator
VLGVPRIEGVERIGPLELGIVAFLACNGGSATPDEVIDAVWGGKAIERGTFLNRLTKTRNALPGVLLGRVNGTRDLSLAEDVGTDLDLFERLVERARHGSSSEAIALLTRALKLVEGVPFDDANFDWAHDRQYHAHACQLIEDATLRVVGLALDEVDIELARATCRRGLIGLPLNEPIYCARMRVEAAAGNRSGVESAFRDLRAGLNDLGDRIDSYEPSPETVRLYEELTGAMRLRSTA